MKRRSALLRLIVAAVVLLHAILLWQRLDDRSIVRPEVAVRWMAAAAIAGVALLLRRSTRDSRGWVVFWLVVALLHVAGPAGAIWTQAVLVATPLLLFLIAGTSALIANRKTLLAAGHRSRIRTGVASRGRDRAPPSR